MASSRKIEMKLPIVLMLLLGVLKITTAKFFSEDIARERLITDIFVNHDAAVRPAPKGERIDVKVKIDLQHFDFQETDGSFHFVGLLAASWSDPKLTWNPKDYNNLTRVPINHRLVWVPDLEVYNNVPAKFLRTHRNGIAVLDHTGTIFWSDNIDVTIFCTTSLAKWPQDEHVCKMRLGSWTYHGYELGLLRDDINATMNFDSINTQSMTYKIVNYTAEHVEILYDCCTEPYVSIDYNITFRRQSSFAVIFRLSGVCVIMLSLVALLMDPRRSEKLWVNAICVIVLNMHLVYFANSIGRLARDIPLIVSFYSWSLVFVTLAHCVSVFSLMATRTRYNGQLPVWCSQFLQWPLVQKIAPPVRRMLKKSETDPLEFEDVKLQENSNLITPEFHCNEWTQMSYFLQRVTFVVMAFVFLILSSTCFV